MESPMPDLMVVVDQKNWREEERDRGAKLEVGDTLDWGAYKSRHPLIAQYHEDGDRFFLVTARGERLWLAAIYEDVYLHHKHDGLYHWRAKTVMPMPIIDITSVRKKLRFHTGNGLT